MCVCVFVCLFVCLHMCLYIYIYVIQIHAMCAYLNYILKYSLYLYLGYFGLGSIIDQ